MKRLAVLIAVFLMISISGYLAVLIATPSIPASAQDRTEERLDDLETQVADLEETVDALSERAGSNGEPDDSHVITGEIRFAGNRNDAWIPSNEDPNGCAGVGAYSDLASGGTFRITDDASKVLVEAEISASILSNEIFLLTFEAEVPDSDVYIIELTPEDTVVYTRDTLEENDWSVSITRRIG